MSKQRHRRRSQGGTTPETRPQTGSGVAHFSVSEVAQFSMSVDTRRSLDGVSDLATALKQESAATAPDLRQALRQLSRTGASAEQTSTQTQQFIRQSQPLLIRTLEDLQQITGASRRLFHSLMGPSGADDAPAHPAAPKQP